MDIKSMGILKNYIKSRHIKAVLEPEDSVADAINIMQKNKGSFVLLQKDQKIVGIFTKTDLANRVVAKALDPSTTTLSSVMTREVVTCDIDDAIEDCLFEPAKNQMRYLPILNKGKLVAVESLCSLLQWVLQDVVEERKHLINYITG
jgi:CBS domain-containing protein